MKIIHFGIHEKENENSGDTVLFKVTKKVFELKFPEVEWINRTLWDRLTIDDINEINNSCDLILIGGGGLLLKDQKGAEKSISGWQFNCSTELIERINKPIVVFGIGYNRFRDQEDFDDVFVENINALVKRTIFFGLRNNGSINKLRPYLKDQSKNKLTLQCCPTVIYREVMKQKSKHKNNKKIISFNLAYDRPDKRFKNEKNQLTQIKEFLTTIMKKEYILHICLHKSIDKEIVKYFTQNELKTIKIIDLSKSSYEEIVSYYSMIDIAIGMRGHSQMIPFGLGKNIISIISHEKIKYFLEDNDLMDYGVEINSLNLFDELIRVFDFYEKNHKNQLRIISENIHKNNIQTQENLVKISDLIGYEK